MIGRSPSELLELLMILVQGVKRADDINTRCTIGRLQHDVLKGNPPFDLMLPRLQHGFHALRTTIWRLPLGS